MRTEVLFTCVLTITLSTTHNVETIQNINALKSIFVKYKLSVGSDGDMLLYHLQK